MEIRDLGFDEWFEAFSNEYYQEGCGFARVSAVDRGAYIVKNRRGDIPAELSGKLSYRIESPGDLPCVGDWVVASYYNDNTTAIIHRLFPRRSFLRRKSSGENVDYQMIAANVDTAFILQSCHYDFNPHRLDRYLIMAADGHVEPVVVLTKTDLISLEELDQQIAVVNSIVRAKVIALSNVSCFGLDDFRQMLSPGRTYCLLGSSGIGKTTLINRLVGRETFDTKAISATGEGTHTTSRRQLILLGQGSMLIDTPGMRELGVIGTGDGVTDGFQEFTGLSANCRYTNCRHESEPGCAILAAVEIGELSKDRYLNYIKIKKESDFHEMSYMEKRKKDKAFGKHIKSVKKQIKR